MIQELCKQIVGPNLEETLLPKGLKPWVQGNKMLIYRKSSIKPPGDYLISDLLEGGLIEGGLFTKSSDKDIFGSFSVLSSHILRNQHTILRLKYINSIQFYPKPY